MVIFRNLFGRFVILEKLIDFDWETQTLVYFSNIFSCLSFVGTLIDLNWETETLVYSSKVFFLMLLFLGNLFCFTWETDILVFIFLFLKCIMGHVGVENRKFCSRGRGRQLWI